MADNIDREAALFAGYSAEVQERIINDLVKIYKRGITVEDVFSLRLSDEILDRLGYANAVEGLLVDYDKIAAQINGTEIVAIMPESVRESLKAIDQQFYFDRVNGAANELKRTLAQAVISETPEGELRKQLFQNSTGLSPGQTETVVNTALRTNSRATFAEATKILPPETRYRYVGPVDGKNRESCHAVLTSSGNNDGFTREEILTDPLFTTVRGDGSTVNFVDGGGWNCRHRFELAV